MSDCSDRHQHHVVAVAVVLGRRVHSDRDCFVSWFLQRVQAPIDTRLHRARSSIPINGSLSVGVAAQKSCSAIITANVVPSYYAATDGAAIYGPLV